MMYRELINVMKAKGWRSLGEDDSQPSFTKGNKHVWLTFRGWHHAETIDGKMKSLGYHEKILDSFLK